MDQRAAIATCLGQLDQTRKDLADCYEALGAAADPCCRTTFPGHFTASLGLVVPSVGLVAIRHRTLQRWLLPGGHIEPDETPEEAARRELLEETNIALDPKLTPFALDLDCHPIPANPAKSEPAHYHYDLRFLFAVETVPQMQMQADEVDGVKLLGPGELRSPDIAGVLGGLLDPILTTLAQKV